MMCGATTMACRIVTGEIEAERDELRGAVAERGSKKRQPSFETETLACVGWLDLSLSSP